MICKTCGKELLPGCRKDKSIALLIASLKPRGGEMLTKKQSVQMG